MATTITEIARELSTTQEVIVDSLTEETPFLEIMPFEPTTHGLSHNYENIEEITGATFTDIDGEVSEVGVESALLTKDLSILSGLDEAGVDKVQKYGGIDAYIAKKAPYVLAQTGMDLEAAFIYNLFRQAAIDAGNIQEPATPSTGNTGYSLVVVRFQRGVCTGLYDQTGFGNGKLIEMNKVENGEPYYIGAAGSRRKVQGWDLRGYTGALVASTKNVSAIVNINISNIASDTTMPDLIDEALLQAQSERGNTVILCHPRLKNKLHAFKGEKLQINIADDNFRRRIDLWEGVPIIATYNMLAGTEADVTVS